MQPRGDSAHILTGSGIKDVLMGIQKSDLSGMAMAVLNAAGL